MKDMLAQVVSNLKITIDDTVEIPVKIQETKPSVKKYPNNKYRLQNYMNQFPPKPTGDFAYDNRRLLEWKTYHCKLWQFVETGVPYVHNTIKWVAPKEHSNPPRKGEHILIEGKTKTLFGIVKYCRYDEQIAVVWIPSINDEDEFPFSELETNRSARIPWKVFSTLYD